MCTLSLCPFGIQILCSGTHQDSQHDRPAENDPQIAYCRKSILNTVNTPVGVAINRSANEEVKYARRLTSPQP
jgi:hypothetical protein